MRISDWSSDVCSSDLAQERSFNVPAQNAARAIPEFARQAGIQIVASGVATRGKTTNAVQGSMSVREGLRILLAGTGLVARGDPASAAVITIVAASDGPSAAARSEEHTSELQSLMRISYAVLCLKKKKKH